MKAGKRAIRLDQKQSVRFVKALVGPVPEVTPRLKKAVEKARKQK